MWYTGKIRSPLRPGVTAVLAEQEFVLSLSCKSWLAGMPYIEVMNATAKQQESRKRNNRAAITFAVIILHDNYPEMTEDMLAEALDFADLRAFYDAVQWAAEQCVPLVASSLDISIPWLVSESRQVPLLLEEDFAAFGPDLERLMERPVLTEVDVVLRIMHTTMARRYADLTLPELSDGLTIPVLLALWPLFLQTSALVVGADPSSAN
jgi:hypothetical protein